MKRLSLGIVYDSKVKGIAKTAWANTRHGAVGLGRTVKGFFTNLFSR